MAGATSQPRSAAVVGGRLAVAELQARVTIRTVAGTVIDHLGHDPAPWRARVGLTHSTVPVTRCDRH